MGNIPLTLNDFESFDKFLFNNEEPNWHKFKVLLNNRRYFLPPIEEPKEIEEYQLCHYAYWMCIAYVYDGQFKPPICAINVISNCCVQSGIFHHVFSLPCSSHRHNPHVLPVSKPRIPNMDGRARQRKCHRRSYNNLAYPQNALTFARKCFI